MNNTITTTTIMAAITISVGYLTGVMVAALGYPWLGGIGGALIVIFGVHFFVAEIGDLCKELRLWQTRAYMKEEPR